MRRRLMMLCLLIAGALTVGWSAASADYADRKNVEIVQMPTVKSIVYGEDLSAAALKGGRAADAETGEGVSGVFEWDRPDYIPGIGDQECLCWFIPMGNDADRYREKLFTLTVSVHRVDLECVELPICLREFVYGEKLKNVPILGGTVLDRYGNEIEGTWTYESGEKQIEAGTEMVGVRFNASDFLHYKSLTAEIRASCRPYTPEVSAGCEPLLIGSRLKDAMLFGSAPDMNGKEIPGVFTFENENQVLDGDGSYPVLFVPEDTRNYTSAVCLAEVRAARYPVRVEVSGVLTEGRPLEEARLSVQAADGEGNPVAGSVRFIENREWYFRGENRVRACFVPDDGKYATQEVTVSLFVQCQVNVWAEIFVTPGQTVGEGLYTLTAVDNVGEEVPGTLALFQEDQDKTWEESGGSVRAVFIPEDGQTYETPHVTVNVVLLEETPAEEQEETP